ncbi:MAG TPA: mechanosensitive ion channel domain-containing protein [Rhodocyclaceae bacterium]|nr:mechanosensitive ion channel domain-containing protein [Rhodocyclaceae bacterium]
MNEKRALRLLGDLWADLSDPNFIWQVVTLVVCLGIAALVGRWWRKRSRGPEASRLRSASSRLAFPLTAVVLVGTAQLALHHFIHVNLLWLAIPLLSTLALVRSTVYVMRYAFPSATWLAASERILTLIIWGSLALYITDLAPFVIDALESVAVPVGKQQITLWMIIHGVVTIFAIVVLALWVAGLLEARLMGIAGLDTSVRIVALRVAKAVLTLMAMLFSLSLIGIDMTALSVFTGALGVGLGFGLQKIASNYVSGFIILLDRSIRIGNIVQVDANTNGVVTQITTRYTVLRNGNGTEFIVPNETLVSNIVQNQSFSDTRVRVFTVVGVAYDTDLDEAMATMAAVAAAHRRVLPDPAPQVFLSQFADSSINLELGFWISDPEGGIGNVRSEVNLALWRAFKEKGIEIPFPQREVRFLNAPAA